MQLKTRIAPTPSGLLHIGNLWSFFLTALIAKITDGQILLRIDDLDGKRIRETYIRNIFETLNLAGIRWHLGPVNKDDYTRHYSQKLDIDKIVRLLPSKSTGQKVLLYRCRCSRNEIIKRNLSRGITGNVYDRFCWDADVSIDQPFQVGNSVRMVLPTKDYFWKEWDGAHLNGGEHALDLDSYVHDQPNTLGDPILITKEGFPAYHLASLYYDSVHQINFIVRGRDLQESSGIQTSVARQLGLFSLEPIFFHHGLVVDDTGKKLSKSQTPNLDLLSSLHAKNLDVLMKRFSKILGCEVNALELTGDRLRQLNLQSARLDIRYRDLVN